MIKFIKKKWYDLKSIWAVQYSLVNYNLEKKGLNFTINDIIKGRNNEKKKH